MQITVTIPDDLVSEVRCYSGRANFAEFSISVLKEWLTTQKIKELNRSVEAAPLEFSPGFSAEEARAIN